MSKVNLSGFKLTRVSVSVREPLIDSLIACNVDAAPNRFRAGIVNLTELVEVVQTAKRADLVLELPEIPMVIRRQKYGRDETFGAFDKVDAVNMAVTALGEYGMTGGLASTFSGRDLTDVLKAFTE